MIPTLETNFLDFPLENPFILASAPPTKDYHSIKWAFENGWAGAITKSMAIKPFTDVTPRMAYIREKGAVTAGINFEMGTIYSIEEWIEIIDQLKREFPEKLLYASIISAVNEQEWRKMAKALSKSRIDGLELNFSCPHLTHKGEGAIVGEDPQLAGQIVKWVKSEIGNKKKIMPKLTYAAGMRIGQVAKKCIENGADAMAAINTVLGLSPIDKETLKPCLNVDGKTTYGGLSDTVIRPFARYAVSEIALAINYQKNPISATGGVADLNSTIDYLALGANHLQICSAVMKQGYLKGYALIKDLKKDLLSYLTNHGYASLDDIRGKALDKVVSYTELSRIKKVVSFNSHIKCLNCYQCIEVCMYQAITPQKEAKKIIIDENKCDGCGSCVSICKSHALQI